MRRLVVTLALLVQALAPAGTDAGDEGMSASPPLPETCDAPDLLERLQQGLDDLRTNRPHDAPDLEAMLPREVAGRRLATWSVIGLDYLGGGPEGSPALPLLSMADRDAFEEMATSLGLVVDDWAMAVGGRSDVEGDPPYFVFAHRIKSVPAVWLEPGHTVDYPDAGTWSQLTLGGRTVRVGTEAMLPQTQHVRGRPYVYDVGDVRFTIVTEDEAWATDALSGLCPDPVAERARFVGGRIEEPDWGFAVTFPSDWIVAELSEASREWLDRWADPEGLNETVLMAQHSGEYECSLIDISQAAVGPPAYTGLRDVVEDEAERGQLDPSIARFDATYLTLAAGQTAVIDRSYGDGILYRDYFFRDGSTWFWLSCSAFEPPPDRWLSVAETFEFLPAEE